MSHDCSQPRADADTLACCAPQAGVSVCLDLSCAEVVQQHAQMLRQVLEQGLVTLCIATMVRACTLAQLHWHCQTVWHRGLMVQGRGGLWCKGL